VDPERATWAAGDDTRSTRAWTARARTNAPTAPSSSTDRSVQQAALAVQPRDQDVPRSRLADLRDRGRRNAVLDERRSHRHRVGALQLGRLFRVAISGLACTKTTWSSLNGSRCSDGVLLRPGGGGTESLYVGGGLSQTSRRSRLAKLDTSTMSATTIGTHPALPEMTGTGNAELWGFFADASMPKVVKFDKATGAAVTSYPQPTLAAPTPAMRSRTGRRLLGVPDQETTNRRRRLSGRRDDRAIKSTTPTTGRTIVGAGVSTCAPTVIF